MKRVTRLRAIATAGAASLLAVGVVTAATAASAGSTPRVSIAGSHPQWASAKAKVSNAAVSSSAVTANVYLAAHNGAGLIAYAKAVSTPGNRLYGHYLSPAQVQRALMISVCTAALSPFMAASARGLSAAFRTVR